MRSRKNPGTPASETVGTSGIATERVAPLTAIAFSRPLLIRGAVAGIGPKLICASPASSAVIAGAPPLYGTSVTWILAIRTNILPVKSLVEPGPALA
jgi:hypothetical protein